jgi:hypothetical protein
VRQPAIRARSVQDALRWADDFAGCDGAVSKAIDPVVYDEVMSAIPSSWIPVELDRHFVSAIYQVHGPEMSRRCWREFMPSHVESPLLKGMVAMSVRLFGLSPAGLLRMAPKLWRHNYRDFCEVESTQGDERHVTMDFRNIHPEVFAVPAYAVCVEAVIGGMCDVVGGARIEMQENPSTASWKMEVHW